MADDKVKIDIRRRRQEPAIYEKNSLYLISDIGEENFVIIVTDPEGNPKKIEAEDLSEYAKLTDLPETSTLQELLDTVPEDIGKLQTPFRLNEWADSKYALKNHTHIWGDITDRPTKLTDFQNDLGNYGDWITENFADNKYALRIRSITGEGSLEGGGDLTQDRVIDLKDETKTNIGLGVEANSWGDHKTEGYLKDSDLDGYATEDWVEGKGYITSYEDTTYTAGEGLDLDGNEFSLTQTVLDSLEEAHTHPNKNILDDITSADIDKWNEAYGKAHTHSNKTILDGISGSDIDNWDEAYSKTHVHANKSTLDSILQGDLDNWNEAYSKAHTHANKTILDGISSSDIEDWEEAYDKKVNAISFTGDTNKTLTVTREDGSILTASFLDNNDPQMPDDVLNTLTFNDNDDGVLRAITSEGSIIDVSLDGRYSLLGHKHVWEDITDRPTSLSEFTNDLGNYGNWITKAQGDTYYSVIGHTHSWGQITGKPTTFAPSAHTHNADDINAGVLNIARIPTGTSGSTVALGNHTHTFASLTGKPTTIGGYGITDFNSLGDARWALRTRTITGTGSLTGGGNLTSNRTLDLTATTKSDIAKGVTAHGWGNHADENYATETWVDDNRLVYSYLATASANLYRPIRRPDGSDIPANDDIDKIYDISLNARGTSAITGYRGIVYYDDGWKVYEVSFASKVSNHPYIIIDTDGVPKVRTDHNNSYSISANVRMYITNSSLVSWRDIVGLTDLDGYATETWVNSQGFLKSNALNNYYTKNESDGRFALRTRTITGTGSLTGGGNLTANRTLDLTATAKSDIAKGVTAYDWGDFRDYGLGTEAVSKSGLLENINETGFYAFSTSQQGFSFPRAMLLNRGSQNYGIIFSNSRDKVGFLTGDELVHTAWHSGNLTNVSQLNNDAGYITSSSLPTVNNGQLTLSTGTGLSGSATFTANQSGSSSFSVAVASTHKLPTTAEWNALPTTNTITRLRGTTSGAYTSGDLTLLAGANTTITQSGANITIASTNTNTTYSNMSLTELNTGTVTTARSISAKTLTDWADGKYALRSRTITGTGSLTGGGDLTSNRTLDLSTDAKSDIAKGVTAHGWGDHSSAGYLKTVPDSFVTKNNITSSALETTVIDFDAPGNGASILYAGASSTNVPSVSGTAGGLLMRGNHSTVGEYQLYLARGENDALLYRNQSGVWNRAASQTWVNSQGFVTTDTTYSSGTLAQLNAGTNTTNRVWGAKPISDFVKSEASVGILLYTFSSVGVLAQDEEQPMKFTILQQDIGGIASVNSSNNNYITIEKEGVYEVTVRTNNNPGAREFNVYADGVRLPGTTMSFGSVQNDTLKSYYFEGNIGSNVVVLGKNELSSPRQLGGEVIIKKL